MNEPGPAPKNKRRRLPWVVAAVLLILAGAAVWDLLEGPTLHASRPLPAMPPGTLGENLALLEGALSGQSSWPLIQELLYELKEPARQGLPGPGATAEAVAEHFQYLEDNRILLPRLREAGSMPRFGQPLDQVQYWEGQRDFLKAKGDTVAQEKAEMQLASVGAGPFRGLTPHLSNLLDLRNLVNLLVLSAREHLEQGRPWEALADLEAALGLGRQLSHRPMIIEQMIGNALIWIARSDFHALVMARAEEWSVEDLERLAASSMVEVPPIRPLRDLVLGEWFAALNIIEFVFHEGGDSTSILKDLTSLGGSTRGWRLTDLSLVLHANRENTLRMMGAIHEDLLKLETMPPAERRGYEIPESILPTGFLSNGRYALPRMMSSPQIYNSLLDGEAASHMIAEASRAIVALLRFRAARGDWPATLEELVPEFLDHLPTDSMNFMSLIYQVTEDGPWLYGIGENGSDDGGKRDDDVFLPIDGVIR